MTRYRMFSTIDDTAPLLRSRVGRRAASLALVATVALAACGDDEPAASTALGGPVDSVVARDTASPAVSEHGDAGPVPGGTAGAQAAAELCAEFYEFADERAGLPFDQMHIDEIVELGDRAGDPALAAAVELLQDAVANRDGDLLLQAVGQLGDRCAQQ